MYEKLIIPAIQHTETKDFTLRYRTYPNKTERDRVYNFMMSKTTRPSTIKRVTLIVIAEPCPEQEELDLS